MQTASGQTLIFALIANHRHRAASSPTPPMDAALVRIVVRIVVGIECG